MLGVTGALSKLSEITGGLNVYVESENYLLNVLMTCIGFSLQVRKGILPVNDFIGGFVSNSFCSCHSKEIQIGYLCPVCMALYCSFVPVCRYCKANLDLFVNEKEKMKLFSLITYLIE